jgi:TP901 family phage tail tape measure protein
MSNRDLSLALRLYADSARFVAGLTQAESGVKRFGSAARREFEVMRGALTSIQGQLAALGLTTGAVAGMMQSARMDKGLTQIGQTAGMSRAEVEKLRVELFRMAGDTGQNVDDLQVGFNNAVQAGLKFREALPVIDATNKAMAVTGASADRLTAGLTVAGQAFNFDLSKPGLAASLLDKMTVAGRQGNAELQNLSDIFARVGVNAASAGMGFDQTLAFIETLSLVERQPERLATLADSTLRLFNNLKYMKKAAETTGVKFFDAKGERRDGIAILRDIKAKYDKLKTDKARAIFLQNAFGEADLDTIKGLKTLLGGDNLAKIGEFSQAIKNATGTIERDLPDAIANAVDQTGRLKSELRKAADEFSRPINDALQNVIKWGLDKKENGGLGLSGKEMVVGGTVAALGTFAAARYGGMALGALAKRFGGTAAGVAEGKALEAAAGVTPVFVVNWPASMGGIPGLPGAASPTAGGTAAGASALRLAGRAGLAIAPFAAMYGVKEWAEDTTNDQGRVSAISGISDAIKSALGILGFNKDADIAARLERNRRELNGENELKGVITVRVEGSPTSIQASTNNPRLPIVADAGRTMVMP